MAGFVAVTDDGVVVAERHGGEYDARRVLPGSEARCVSGAEDVVLVGGRGVHRSADGGGSWQPAGLEAESVTAVAASRLGTSYAGTSEGAVFVAEAGNWRPAAALPHPRLRSRTAVTALAVSPADAATVLAASRTLLRSGDAGATWSASDGLGDTRGLAFHAYDEQWAYAAGSGAAASRDGGATWERVLEHRHCTTVAADPGRPDLWYVGSENSVLRTAGGGPWEEVSEFPAPVAALVTDPAATAFAYAVLEDGTAWRSVDFGDAWERLALELGSGVRAAALT
jgi:hypothetical protein